MCSSAEVKRFPETDFPKKFSSAFGWGGAAYSKPVNPLGYMGGQKFAIKTPSWDSAIQIPAQQPRIEIDVLNLRSAGDLTIFRPLAFMEILPNSGVQHRDFLGESTSR